MGSALQQLLTFLGKNDVSASQVDDGIKVMSGELYGLPEGVATAPCQQNERVVDVVFRDDGDYDYAVVPRDSKAGLGRALWHSTSGQILGLEPTPRPQPPHDDNGADIDVHGRNVTFAKDGSAPLVITDHVHNVSCQIEFKQPEYCDNAVVKIIPSGYLILVSISVGWTAGWYAYYLDREFKLEAHRYGLDRIQANRVVGDGLIALRSDGKEFVYLRPYVVAKDLAGEQFCISTHRRYGAFDNIQLTKDGLKGWHWVDGTFYVITYK